jgi:hypothetical protein
MLKRVSGWRVERGDSDDGYVDLEKQNFRTAHRTYFWNLRLFLKKAADSTRLYQPVEDNTLGS